VYINYLCPTYPIISPPISTIIICEHDSQALHAHQQHAADLKGRLKRRISLNYFYIVFKLVEIKSYKLGLYHQLVAKHNQDRTRFHILFLYSHKMLFIGNNFIGFKKDL
jgi:hypothetical protein